MTPSRRIQELPPYLFAEIERLKTEAILSGADLIDLGVGDPDLPTPAHIVEALQEAAARPENHRYPTYAGMFRLRQAVADWYRLRFGVELNPQREVIILIGTKEGIAHLPLGTIDPGDLVLAPEPAYPVYRIGTHFAGGRLHALPLRWERSFLPDLEAVPAEARRHARLLYLNYPNNPTSAVAGLDFFTEAVEFARANQILVAHDAAYTEISWGEEAPPSFLQAPGAREVAIEFHSFSKTFNMTGWRVGFAVGHAEAVAALGAVKTNIDSGVFQAVQEAAMAALRAVLQRDAVHLEEMRRVYRGRRRVLVEGLRGLGLEVWETSATFYVWMRVPRGQDSTGFAMRLLKEAGIVATPGVGFGAAGEGYVRMAFTVEERRLREVVERMRAMSW